MGIVERHALPLAVSSCDEWRQTMRELFELGGMAATLVAACQGNLLQALLNGDATPTMYAEELGLDPTATERILEVLACLGSPTATRVSMAHLLSSRTLTPAAQG